jgi:hypothetical protein
MVTNLSVPENVAKFFSGQVIGGFSRRPQLHGNSYGSIFLRIRKTYIFSALKL